MTKQQIHWAKQHGWFLKARENGVVVVIDFVLFSDGSYRARQKEFTDYKELRAWAGY